MPSDENDILFLAVLIYDDGNNRYSEERRPYRASHPEIAYRLALAEGSEARYGRRFVGLAHLAETDEEIDGIARSTGGNAADFVVPKDELDAFRDPRWRDVPCDESELAEALRPPRLLFEIDGVDGVAWDQLTHAYGPAFDVPRDLRRLAAEDPEIRRNALWELGGSIYHQGTIYPATAAALPFLIRLTLDERTPDRKEVCGLLKEIASSASFHPEQIRRNWRFREKLLSFWEQKPSEMAADEIATVEGVRAAFAERLDSIRSLERDPDVDIAARAQAIVRRIEAPGPELPACFQCQGKGKCRCRRKGEPTKPCNQCDETGICHVCLGMGAASP
jgi:hypothetical protein